MRNGKQSFTLIELLVVIAVIMILMAMLLPVLGRAKHMAKLTVCAGNQRQIALGAILYASDNSRLWPYRQGNYDTSGNPRPYAMAAGGTTNPFDDRPRFSPYFSLNELSDPFLTDHDYDGHSVAAGGNAMYTYALYFGWKLNDGGGQRMKRMGDTMTEDSVTGEFDIIVADVYRGNTSGLDVRVNHPTSGAWEAVWSAPNTLIWSFFFARYGAGRVDNNYIRSDGSLNRITGVTPGDPRVTGTAGEYGDPPTKFILLPPVD
jgi:type II secretory pathway pseudopilin PulG